MFFFKKVTWYLIFVRLYAVDLYEFFVNNMIFIERNILFVVAEICTRFKKKHRPNIKYIKNQHSRCQT